MNCPMNRYIFLYLMGILYNATAVGKARNGVWHAFVEVLQIQ